MWPSRWRAAVCRRAHQDALESDLLREDAALYVTGPYRGDDSRHLAGFAYGRLDGLARRTWPNWGR